MRDTESARAATAKLEERAPVLIAGFGNVLRGDDGFGPAVIDALESAGGLSTDARAIDVGTGGLNLVRELFDGYSALVIVDAVDRGGTPGTVYVLDVTVPDIDTLGDRDRYALAADMHAAMPDRALLVAAAAGVLPSRVWLVGCQPGSCDECGAGMSEAVRNAIGEAVQLIRQLVANDW